jgi:protein-tyrosine phosphatase
MIRVMFVCLGNICRSPAGEGVLRHMAEKEGVLSDLTISSCGIGDWHIGHPPDSRIREAAKSRGITLNTKAKPFVPNYLEEFDYILASDESVREHLLKFAKNPEQRAKVYFMTAFAKAYKDIPVPDPYYEGDGAFEHVLDILEDSCKGLLDEIKSKL